MLFHKSKALRSGQMAGAILLVGVLTGCGGGGGSDGGGSGGSPPSGSPPSGAPPSLDGLNCVALEGGGGAGFVLGVCSVTGPSGEQSASTFQDFPVTVTTDPNIQRRFTITVQSPNPITRPGGVTLDDSGENCSANTLGNRRGYATESYTDPTNPVTSPRFTLVSMSQTYGLDRVVNGQPTCRTPNNQRSPIGEYPQVYSDFGAWERYAGGATLYYGGWYALRGNSHAFPANNAAPYIAGLVAGYRFTSTIGYGMSAEIRSGARWNGNSITLVIDPNSFRYSRPGTTPPPQPSALPEITLTSTAVVSGTKVRGTVTGDQITGSWEGEFAGPQGQEFVGKFKFTQESTNNKVSGSFALKR